ncbi:MAG: multidrug ABC transporter ATP-binding protein [SAR324 cluster bacterium]|uniref:Multidrug ABC transporter ATP-binding protein n=1 Tax=SAR324 cluster bacterium TaxID=2024889 RepID=A0A2D6YGH8_9DELT|nr:multidrug ABC transporter ATP-binding protein [SAR324 cluster bacterium]
MFSWFEDRLNPFPNEDPTQPPQGLVAFCWHYAKPAGPWLFLMSAITALISIGEVYLFGFLGNIVDWLAVSGQEGFLEREGSKLIWMGAVLLIGLPTIVLLQSLLVHQTLLGNFPMIARWQMHRYLLRQSVGFFANEFAGRVATKVMQTSLSIRESVMKLLDVFVYVSVNFISMMVLIALADWVLALPLLLWVIVYIILIRYFVPRLKKVSSDQADARSSMTGRVVDSYTNITTVKLFSHAGGEAAYAKESMEGFLVTVHQQMRMFTQFQFAVYFNNVCLVFAVSALAIWLWLGSVVSVGSIAISIALCLRINGMSQWIMWEVSSLFENIGVVHDGMTMMVKPHEIVDQPKAQPLDVPQGQIEFAHIGFHYGKASGVIDDLSLKITAGEKIGLVGRSGAGKTTLMNLLLRFYDLERGRVLIDEQDIAQMTQESLRSCIGVVTQDTSLLHRSIRENIAYSAPEATDEQVIEAARKASAWDFIQELEDSVGRKGLDAHVGERGVKLSGGQRQRIAIARVFLKDAPILVLDEATSALDSEVEAAIQENLFQLMEGKTVIAIAHRLSTIAQLDRLVVIDAGNLIESGSHDELVQNSRIYGDLWARQSGGFLAPEEYEEKTQAA